MRVVILKKLYGGYASIRSTTVDSCIKANESLRILYKDQWMTLSPKDLTDRKVQLSNRIFRSLYDDDKCYFLCDYPWRPDKNEINKNALMDGRIDNFGKKLASV